MLISLKLIIFTLFLNLEKRWSVPHFWSDRSYKNTVWIGHPLSKEGLLDNKAINFLTLSLIFVLFSNYYYFLANLLKNGYQFERGHIFEDLKIITR